MTVCIRKGVFLEWNIWDYEIINLFADCFFCCVCVCCVCVHVYVWHYCALFIYTAVDLPCSSFPYLSWCHSDWPHRSSIFSYPTRNQVSCAVAWPTPWELFVASQPCSSTPWMSSSKNLPWTGRYACVHSMLLYATAHNALKDTRACVCVHILVLWLMCCECAHRLLLRSKLLHRKGIVRVQAVLVSTTSPLRCMNESWLVSLSTRKVNNGDRSWYPKEKVVLAKKKLQGHNSARLMLWACWNKES